MVKNIALAFLPCACSSRRWKFKLVPLHVDTCPSKRYALHLQPESLFGAVFTSQLDRAARSQHAMPRQSLNLLENTNDLSRGARPSGGAGDAAVAGYLTARQGTYALNDAGSLSFYFRWLRFHEKIILLFTGIGKDQAERKYPWFEQS